MICCRNFTWVSQNHFSMNSPCYYFTIALTGEGEGGDLRVGVRGGLFKDLFLTGVRHSNNVYCSDASDPCPNCAPACGRPEILGTTTTPSSMGSYCGWWLVGTNQRPGGTVQGGRGGGDLVSCACVFGGKIDHGGCSIQDHWVSHVRLKMMMMTHGPSYLGGGIRRAPVLSPYR